MSVMFLLCTEDTMGEVRWFFAFQTTTETHWPLLLFRLPFKLLLIQHETPCSKNANQASPEFTNSDQLMLMWYSFFPSFLSHKFGILNSLQTISALLWATDTTLELKNCGDTHKKPRRDKMTFKYVSPSSVTTQYWCCASFSWRQSHR